MYIYLHLSTDDILRLYHFYSIYKSVPSSLGQLITISVLHLTSFSLFNQCPFMPRNSVKIWKITKITCIKKTACSYKIKEVMHLLKHAVNASTWTLCRNYCKRRSGCTCACKCLYIYTVQTSYYCMLLYSKQLRIYKCSI